MAMTDEEAEKLKAELAQTKAQLAQLVDEKKNESLKKPEEKKPEDKNEKPEQPKVDQDLVKEIAACKARIEVLEKRLGEKTTEDGKPKKNLLNPLGGW